MAKKIRFPLEMKDGVEVRSIEELKDNFSLAQVLFYLSNGKLDTWLRDRYLDEIADEISELNQEDTEFNKRICSIFEVEYNEEAVVDLEKEKERKQKLEILKNFTDDKRFFDVVDKIAFEQDDVYDLLDEGERILYLCGDRFSIPLGKKGISYIGINNPIVVISSKNQVDFGEKGIIFENVRFDEKYQKILDDLEPKKEETEVYENNARAEYGEYLTNSYMYSMLSKDEKKKSKECYKKISVILDAMECDF